MTDLDERGLLDTEEQGDGVGVREEDPVEVREIVAEGLGVRVVKEEASGEEVPETEDETEGEEEELPQKLGLPLVLALRLEEEVEEGLPVE